MQIRFIPCLIFHIYKSEKSGGWVGMVGGGGNIARGVKQDIKTGYCRNVDILFILLRLKRPSQQFFSHHQIHHF